MRRLAFGWSWPEYLATSPQGVTWNGKYWKLAKLILNRQSISFVKIGFFIKISLFYDSAKFRISLPCWALSHSRKILLQSDFVAHRVRSKSMLPISSTLTFSLSMEIVPHLFSKLVEYEGNLQS